LRPATLADVMRFYGEPQQVTLQAVVMEVEGEIVGIGGLAYDGDKLRAFGDLKPAAFEHKHTIARAARMIAGMAGRACGPVFTAADPQYAESPKLLRRLGFKPFGHDGDKEVFKWPN
jgi:hypothetical protein